MAQRILKNQTENDITIDDLGAKLIPAYGEIDFGASFTLAQLSNSEDLILALAQNVQANGFSAFLILNDGSEDLKAADAVDLIRNIYQRTNQTKDGDSIVVYKKPSTITGNRVIDKSTLIVIDSQTDHHSVTRIPNGKTWYIESFGGGSDDTPVRICLSYKKNHDDDFSYSFLVDPQYDSVLTLNQQAGSGDLTLYVNNLNDELNSVEPDRLYAFAKYNDPTQIIERRIVTVDPGSNAIVLDQALGDIFPVGSYIALVQKSIRSVTVKNGTTFSEFSSPIKIVGDGNNAVCLCIRNLSTSDYATVSAFFNGYEESTGA